MNERVTMKTVAEHAGVTQATVSMSLANHPRISAETRARIQGIVKKLGYRPNPYLSTLMRMRRQGRPLGEKPVLALVSAFERPDEWRLSPFPTLRQMREGAMARAVLRGYRTQEFWLHQDGMSNDRFSEMLHARGIQGVLLGPSAENASMPALTWEYFAAVSLSVPSPLSTVTTVCNDHYFSSLQAARECYQRGYRRIGLVMLKSHHARFQGRWEAGCLIAPRLLPGLEVVESLLIDDWTETMTAPLLRWLRKEKPDVILSSSAHLLQSRLTRRNFKVPDDIGLVHLACPEMNDRCSGIYQNGHLIGATAIDVLTNLVERNERGLPSQANTVMIEGLWNAGHTLRAPVPVAVAVSV